MSIVVSGYLNVEENEEFTEFGSAVSPYHECVVYITEPNFWFFECFSEGLFLKMLHEDVGGYRRNRRAHCNFCLFIKLVDIGEVSDC